MNGQGHLLTKELSVLLNSAIFLTYYEIDSDVLTRNYFAHDVPLITKHLRNIVNYIIINEDPYPFSYNFLKALEVKMTMFLPPMLYSPDIWNLSVELGVATAGAALTKSEYLSVVAAAMAGYKISILSYELLWDYHKNSALRELGAIIENWWP
jgi:hypothetical protein